MKKYLIFFLQAIGIFAMVYIAVAVLPPTAQTEVYRSYIKSNISPYKTSNREKYLQLLSSFNGYTFQESELFKITSSQDDSNITIYGYLLASNKDNNNNNGIFLYIENAYYKSEEFLQLALEVHYDKNLNRNSQSPVKKLDPTFVAQEDGIRGFYISNYYFDDINFAKITGLTFGILTKNHSNDNFLSISDVSAKTYLLNETFTDKNINLNVVNISSKISDPKNIPTEQEILEYNLFYESFNKDSLMKYYYIYIIFYFVFFLVISPIIYFGYINPSIKQRRLQKNGNKSQ